MLNIVIPMAGRGSRFANAGYKLPKPLIDVNGKPMVQVVVENLRPKQEHKFIFICLKEHIEKYNLVEKLNGIAPGCEIVPVAEVTEGAACTVLLAEEYIGNDDALMIANSDQFIDFDINEFLSAQADSGLIMTMKANDKKWSYIRVGEHENVTEVREKELISDEATVGIYFFTHGCDYAYGAKQMISKNLRVNNEFYVAPVYNEMISDGKIIRYLNIGSVEERMYGLGTPDDLDLFLTINLSKIT